MKNKNNGLYVLIGILCVLVLVLGGYIVYDKVLSKPAENETNNNQSDQTNEAINKEYHVGDEITFNNEKWHVITESTTSDDYVVVLKDQDLSDLKQKPYYECPEEDENDINCNMKMSNDYEKSVAKKYFDETYINTLNKNNLKEINGYYIRLITINELETLGCDLSTESCSNAPSWLTSNIVSWTMSYTTDTPTDDASDAFVYSFGYDSYSNTNGIYKSGVGSTLNVRPVINLLKSSIE